MGELGGRNVTAPTTANHQSPVKYSEEERRHALCFKGAKGLFIKAHRCDSNISKTLQTVLIIFLFNINCELRGAAALHECEGVGSVSVLRSTPPPGVYFTLSLASSSCIKEDLPLSGLIFSLAVILMPIPSCTERTGKRRKV